MSDLVQRFTKATADFGENVHAIKADQWGDATPCAEWDVRALTRHLVYEMLWVAPLFGGKTVAEVGDAYEGEILGDDPVAAWDAARAAADAAVTAPGAIDSTVNLSRGEVPAGDYAVELINDLVVHGWDLAKGIGIDSTIDEEEAGRLLEWLRPHAAALSASGAFAESIPVPDTASNGDHLVALLGRSPAWPD